MGHLKDVGLSYFKHFFVALNYAFRLNYAIVCLIVHAFCPNLFVRTASRIVKEVWWGMHNPTGDSILIRFNTKFEEDEKKRLWRVVVNGEERLAAKVFLYVTGETISFPIEGIQKYHISCTGKCNWENDTVYIV